MQLTPLEEECYRDRIAASCDLISSMNDLTWTFWGLFALAISVIAVHGLIQYRWYKERRDNESRHWE